jgi:Rrf2 family iron-sulfur cluster assembly transcriptional regulator
VARAEVQEVARRQDMREAPEERIALIGGLQ